MTKLTAVSLLLIISFGFTRVNAQLPFTKGVNLTDWFSSENARTIPFSSYSKKDLQNIKDLGCDVIRLPVSLHKMTTGAPDYKIDTILYQYLDKVVDWTEELQMNLIIDNHTIPDAGSITVETPLTKVWPQMARHFKNRSTRIFYEILNEPHTMPVAEWARIQQRVVELIRVHDTTHTIIVTGAGWGGIPGLIALEKLNDPKLIYSFHFYDPLLFTHQGASWGSPSLADLAGVPFPYNEAKMPACPASLRGTWAENSINNSYKTEGTIDKLRKTIDEAVKYATDNKVKIFCGELGVFMPNSPEPDRVEWYKAVTSYLNEKSIPWTMWDYRGGFGLFKKNSGEIFEYDLNRPLSEAIGFTLPPLKEYILKPDSLPFDIYTDFPGDNIRYHVPSTGTADLFSADKYEGTSAIHITELLQHNYIDFDFRFVKDLSKLVAADYHIEFRIKADVRTSDIVFRFIDTKTDDPKDHPWRMDYTINNTLVPFDGNWHLVKIPLKNFSNAGSWDNNTWYNSNNSFDWKAVDRFQIVAEHMALSGKNFWFDNIRISNSQTVGLNRNIDEGDFKASIFPNPFSERVTVAYNLPVSSKVDMCIYNLEGTKITNIVSTFQPAGFHEIYWTPPHNISGVWLCKISTATKTELVKLIRKTD